MDRAVGYSPDTVTSARLFQKSQVPYYITKYEKWAEKLVEDLSSLEKTDTIYKMTTCFSSILFDCSKIRFYQAKLRDSRQPDIPTYTATQASAKIALQEKFIPAITLLFNTKKQDKKAKIGPQSANIVAAETILKDTYIFISPPNSPSWEKMLKGWS